MSATLASPSADSPIEKILTRLDAIEQMTKGALQKVEQHAGRLAEVGRDMGRLRGRLKLPAAASDAADPQPPVELSGEPSPAGLTQEDLRLALKLGREISTLPKATQELIEKQQADGMNYRDAARFVELLRSVTMTVAPPEDGKERTASDLPAPLGQAGTSAQRISPAHPRSASEFAMLRKSDPERFKELMRDPTFAPEDLPSVVRQ